MASGYSSCGWSQPWKPRPFPSGGGEHGKQDGNGRYTSTGACEPLSQTLRPREHGVRFRPRACSGSRPEDQEHDMAERVTSDAPAWEKSGNVTWVQCPKCRGWLPVDPKLAASDAIKM